MLMNHIARAARSAFSILGCNISRRQSRAYELPEDIIEPHASIIQSVRGYTMTSVERLNALIEAVDYIIDCDIPGSLVECGVWRGGSMMAAALTLLHRNRRDRDLYLFDTFTGMTLPTAEDVDIHNIDAAGAMINDPVVRCEASLDSVKKLLFSTGYPQDRLHFVQGDVQDTIPSHAPNEIAILRLDTDWYNSTRYELAHLYPRLTSGGVLIIDDYGHWKGARQAVDEYLAAAKPRLLLNRIDYTGRIAVKSLPGHASC